MSSIQENITTPNSGDIVDELLGSRLKDTPQTMKELGGPAQTLDLIKKFFESKKNGPK